MANRTARWKLWGETFKQFRLRAGYASQGELADALSHLEMTSDATLVLSASQISRWESGQRCPSRREQHLALIEGLVKLGCISTPQEADTWLQAGSRGVLSGDERKLLFSEAPPTQTLPRTQAGV